MREQIAAASLATADEILMRVAPTLLGGPERGTVADIIAKDRQQLLEVLDLLADGIEAQSTINVYTGHLSTHVDPEFFKKFREVMERQAGRRVLDGVPWWSAVSRAGLKEAKG